MVRYCSSCRSLRGFSLVGLLVPLLLLLAAPLAGQTVQVAHAATTIEVTNGNDSGPGSLRQVIADAAAGDTITFAESVDTVTLTSDQLTIDKDLTIDGGDGVTIERSSEAGTPEFSIFEITDTSMIDTGIVLNSLTIRNGKSPDGAADQDGEDGGGIYNNSTLTVTNSIIRGNRTGASGDSSSITTATLGGNGGGIYNDGTLTVINSVISGNQTGVGDNRNPYFYAGNGGGIYNDGTLTVTNSTISDNTAQVSDGIYNASNGLTVIERSTISGNSNGIANDAGTLNVINSTISNNAGKGIWAFGGDSGGFDFSRMTVRNSTINGNGGTGIISGADTKVLNSTISGNSDGGIRHSGSTSTSDILIVINSTITGNTSSDVGGGIYNNFYSSVILVNTIVANNTDSTGDNDIHNGHTHGEGNTGLRACL